MYKIREVDPFGTYSAILPMTIRIIGTNIYFIMSPFPNTLIPADASGHWNSTTKKNHATHQDRSPRQTKSIIL
jgi:hypothetical protein